MGGSGWNPDTLPADFQSELMATRHFVPREYGFAFTNGIQASYLEVDTETGFIKLLKHWVVEDCGQPINPQLVDEQVRGGVVQGLGAALFEQCRYDDQGQMINANMADYLVPMAGEMPDIEVGHVITPTRESAIGAKGGGHRRCLGLRRQRGQRRPRPVRRGHHRNPALAGGGAEGVGKVKQILD